MNFVLSTPVRYIDYWSLNFLIPRCSDFIMCNVKCCACSRIAWNSHSFLIIVNGYGNYYNAVWVHCKVLSSSSLHRYVALWKLCLFVMYSKSYWQDLKKKHFIMFCSFLCLSVDFKEKRWSVVYMNIYESCICSSKCGKILIANNLKALNIVF